MSQRRPPILATWLLQHLGDRYRRDALIGDLIEEYHQGRSYGWYWRQAFSALFAAGRNTLRRHRSSLLALAIWWGVWVTAGIVFKSVVLWIFALDSSLLWLLRAKVKKRRARAAPAAQ